MTGTDAPLTPGLAEYAETISGSQIPTLAEARAARPAGPINDAPVSGSQSALEALNVLRSYADDVLATDQVDRLHTEIADRLLKLEGQLGRAAGSAVDNAVALERANARIAELTASNATAVAQRNLAEQARDAQDAEIAELETALGRLKAGRAVRDGQIMDLEVALARRTESLRVAQAAAEEYRVERDAAEAALRNIATLADQGRRP